MRNVFPTPVAQAVFEEESLNELATVNRLYSFTINHHAQTILSRQQSLVLDAELTLLRLRIQNAKSESRLQQLRREAVVQHAKAFAQFDAPTLRALSGAVKETDDVFREHVARTINDDIKQYRPVRRSGPNDTRRRLLLRLHHIIGMHPEQDKLCALLRDMWLSEKTLQQVIDHTKIKLAQAAIMDRLAFQELQLLHEEVGFVAAQTVSVAAILACTS
ncbi:hypothetical protein AURDEDRAFT_157900 [Auricularia subglabra TFB-10046 SS5]|nr:hypothetical protein AURDEDRAFT_157900 [Auricularia subglabra TFB-10046 SS5]